MTSIRIRIKHLVLTALLVVSSIALPLANAQTANAATVTWDGQGMDGKFSTAANWSNDTLPVDGDILTLAPLASTNDSEWQTLPLTNDLSGVEFGGITTTTSSSGADTTYYLDKVDLMANATIQHIGTGDKKASVSMIDESYNRGVINAAGNLTVKGVGIYSTLNVTGNVTSDSYLRTVEGSNITGSITLKAGGEIQPALVKGALTLSDNSTSKLKLSGPSATISSPITVGSLNKEAAYGIDTNIAFGNCSISYNGAGSGPSSGVYCQEYATATYTLTGTLTLRADTTIHVADKSTVNITGNINYNGFKLLLQTSSKGELKVKGSEVTISAKSTTYNDKKPSDNLIVVNKETATFNGTRAFVNVQPGGVLKGTGTAQSIYVALDALIAPGKSPGTITTKETIQIAGEYQAELLNKDTYDQLIVGKDFNESYDAVNLNESATLNTVLYNGWSIKKGDSFTIIDNQSKTDVNGIFKGLTEGKQFTVSNEGKSITFSITYKGGDGNDVVLTALSTGQDPTPPNTGVAQLVMANPVVTAVLGATTIALLGAIAIRRQRANR